MFYFFLMLLFILNKIQKLFNLIQDCSSIYKEGKFPILIIIPKQMKFIKFLSTLNRDNYWIFNCLTCAFFLHCLLLFFPSPVSPLPPLLLLSLSFFLSYTVSLSPHSPILLLLYKSHLGSWLNSIPFTTVFPLKETIH